MNRSGYPFGKIVAAVFVITAGVASAEDVTPSDPLILDFDDLSFDLGVLQSHGVDGLTFAGALPVPETASLGTVVNWSLDDSGVSAPVITTNASATYVISPQVAARVTYQNQMNSTGKDRNLLRVDAALNTNCMGRFDVTGELDADKGSASFKKLVWHIPRIGAC